MVPLKIGKTTSFLVQHIVGILMGLVAFAAFYGQKIERTLFPFADEAEIVMLEPYDKDEAGIAMRFTAHRNRSCTYIESKWYIETANGLVHEPRVHVVGELPLNRPLGKNLSPVNIFPRPGFYTLRVVQDCGFPWDSVVEFGPFPIYLKEGQS